jgi:SAM-dependent MidA family methyltransferase
MDRWMQEALYHPEFGYYTSGIRGIGRGGDFTTWPVMEGSLAAGLCKWIKSQPHKRHLIEIGAGTGALAAALIENMTPWKGWLRKPTYHIVEASPTLQKTQQNLLRGKDVTWHDSVNSALKACHGKATLIANELVDAFPCRVFRMGATGWEERFVGLNEGKLQDIWEPAKDQPESTAWNHTWRVGQHVEVHESFAKWLASWRGDWQEGSLLLIDYGAECPDVFRDRPLGTLRAYSHHQRIEGLAALQGFGLRDLTADVNFSDLSQFAQATNLQASTSRSLAQFLKDHHVNITDPRLVEPGGAGDVFCTIVLQA